MICGGITNYMKKMKIINPKNIEQSIYTFPLKKEGWVGFFQQLVSCLVSRISGYDNSRSRFYSIPG